MDTGENEYMPCRTERFGLEVAMQISVKHASKAYEAELCEQSPRTCGVMQ